MKKVCYIDVMTGRQFDKFHCQLRYEYLPCFPIVMEDVEDWVREKRPELKKMNFRLAFGNRVFR